MPKLPKGYLGMDSTGYAGLSISVQRAVYKALRDIVRYTVGKADADYLIGLNAPKTPVDWIMAAKLICVSCARCKGSGIYYWGASINGHMTNSGPCARCGGNGRMTFDDMRRGKAYDNYAIQRAMRY